MNEFEFQETAKNLEKQYSEIRKLVFDLMEVMKSTGGMKAHCLVLKKELDVKKQLSSVDVSGLLSVSPNYALKVMRSFASKYPVYFLVEGSKGCPACLKPLEETPRVDRVFSVLYKSADVRTINLNEYLSDGWSESEIRQLKSRLINTNKFRMRSSVIGEPVPHIIETVGKR